MATKRRAEALTDAPWTVLAPLIPDPPRRAARRGRTGHTNRDGLQGIVWVVRSGARGQDLPDRFPSYQTCHRRFQHGVRHGVLHQVLEAFAADLRERGALEVAACFIDGTWVVAKKGGQVWARPSAAKGGNAWQWQTLLVFLSPSTQHLLARMKSPLYTLLLQHDVLVSRLSV